MRNEIGKSEKEQKGEEKEKSRKEQGKKGGWKGWLLSPLGIGQKKGIDRAKLAGSNLLVCFTPLAIEPSLKTARSNGGTHLGGWARLGQGIAGEGRSNKQVAWTGRVPTAMEALYHSRFLL